MSEGNASGRIAKWDNIKFILIYLVVLGHMIANLEVNSAFLKTLQLFIYLFHMPAFLFIAGLFSKRTIDGVKLDRAFTYLYLYFFMVAFRFVVYSFLGGKAGSTKLFTEGGVPWFALTMFLFYLATMAVRKLDGRYLLIMAVGLGMMAGYDTNLGDFLCGMRFFTLYPFFLAGYLIPVEKVTEFTGKRYVKISSWILLIVTALLCWIYRGQLSGKLRFFKGSTSYSTLKMLPYGGIYRGLYYLAIAVLVVAVIAVVPSGRSICSKWGQRTIQVFALHFPVMKILIKTFHIEKYLRAIWPAHYGLLVPLVALMLTVLLSSAVITPFFDFLMQTRHRGEKASK